MVTENALDLSDGAGAWDFLCPVLGKHGEPWGLPLGKRAAALHKDDSAVVTSGQARLSGIPDLSLLVISNSDQASCGSTNSPSGFWPLLAPEAMPRARRVVQDLSPWSYSRLPRFQNQEWEGQLKSPLLSQTTNGKTMSPQT